MSEKNAVWSIILVQILSVVIIMSVNIIIDPIGIWNTQVVQGINNYKLQQRNYLDTFKVYKYLESDVVETVHIGSSTTVWGYKPANDKIFNFGLSSLNIPNTIDYLNFIFNMKKPGKIILELNITQFTQNNYYSIRPGFSKSRLEALQRGKASRLYEKMKETLASYKLIFSTVRDSMSNKAVRHDRGINGWMGNIDDKGERSREYVRLLNGELKYPRITKFEPESLEALKNILSLAEKNDVEVVVFFAPMSIDLLAIMDVRHQLDEFYSLKSKIKEICPVYDFAWANNIVVNRNLYFDPWHYRAVAGDIVLDVLEGKTPPDGLATNNYEKQKLAYEKWKEKKENSEYVELLKNAKEKISDDILKKHLNLD